MISLNVRVTSTGLVENGKRKLRATMRRAGAEVASVARSELRRAKASGRTYYVKGGAFHVASAPGEPPATLSGTLARSLKVYPFKSGEGVAVRARAFYALFLERGAKGGGGRKKAGRNRRGKPTTARVLLPRPFLTKALDSRADSISRRIRAAIVEDIAFKRLRP